MKQGITLIEILLVILPIIFLALLIFPIGISFYKNQQLQAHTQGILQTLRRAQLKAMGAEQDSTFGVYITNGNYILFKGNSYASRDAQYDEIFDLPQIIIVQDAPKEIIFSKFEGKPNIATDITMMSNGESERININGLGRMSLQ